MNRSRDRVEEAAVRVGRKVHAYLGTPTDDADVLHVERYLAVSAVRVAAVAVCRPVHTDR